MAIVCLGWGSLVWRPEKLPVRQPWRVDGPKLPIEFARQSDNGRVTLVVVPGVEACCVLWTELEVSTLEEATRVLSMREGPGVNLNRVAHWSRASSSQRPEAAYVEEWASTRPEIDAVVWTALGPRFHGENGRVPNEQEVIAYLRELKGEPRDDAASYVRLAPVQIRTRYRDAIEEGLGWTPQVKRLDNPQ